MRINQLVVITREELLGEPGRWGSNCILSAGIDFVYGLALTAPNNLRRAGWFHHRCEGGINNMAYWCDVLTLWFEIHATNQR